MKKSNNKAPHNICRKRRLLYINYCILFSLLCPEEEIEPPILISKVIFLKAKILGQEDIVIPTVKPRISISWKGVDLVVEDLLPMRVWLPKLR